MCLKQIILLFSLNSVTNNVLLTNGAKYWNDPHTVSEHFTVYDRGTDKSLARRGRKQANVFCQNGVNFIRRPALLEKKP